MDYKAEVGFDLRQVQRNQLCNELCDGRVCAYTYLASVQDTCSATTKDLQPHYKQFCTNTPYGKMRFTNVFVKPNEQMLSLLEHCHGEKTHFSRNEKRTFSLSQMNNVELARTLPWRENALFEGREKNKSINLFFAPYSEVVLTLNISTN